MGITIHDSKGEEYVVPHDVSPYTLLEDDAPSKIDIQHVDRATSTTGTTPSNSTHPFLHPRVRVLIAGFSGLVVAAAVVVISVRSSRGSTPVASPYVRFGSHYNSEKARSNLFHDIVRDTNAMVGQADDEFVTSSNENVNLLNAKKTLLSDIIRDSNMVIGQGDDELIGSLDANEEVLPYEILSSDDRHPEPKTLEEKQQIYNEIVRDVANIIGQGDDEFVDQSVRSSANSRQEGMNHETITLAEQFKRHNEIVRDAKKAIGQGDDEFVDSSYETSGSVDSSEEYRISNETSSMRTHPEPKILVEEKFEMNQDFVRDVSNTFGQVDDLFQPTTIMGSVDSSNTFVHGDDLFLESMESDDRHPEPKSLSEAIEIYHDIVRDARSTIGQGDDEYIPGSSRYSDESLKEQDRSYDDDLIETNNRQYPESKTLVEKFVLYNNIVHDAEQAVGQRDDDDDEFVARNGSLMTEGKEDR